MPQKRYNSKRTTLVRKGTPEMSLSTRLKLTLAASIAAAISLGAYAQNAEPNPYRTIENWAKLPKGMHFGQVIQVIPDNDGRSMWVFHRASPHILKFDENGNLLKIFGDSFVQAHGFTIDK